MAKPFNIQSPEDIAKTYGGNKQKIAEAMQMGIVDATAGVLAGMFIDKMRSAAQMESMPQSTVAQQVMGGAPPTPSLPPATGGLGGTPQAAPPMTPMQPPMPAPEGAPMGMAAGGSTYEPPYMKGGLSDVPIPDTMYDEPSNGGFNDGYAGGGIVAFAQGGLGWANSSVTSPYGEKRSYEVHRGIDFGVANKTPIGVIGGGVVETASHDHVNGNYVVVRHPNGMTTSYSHLSTLDVKPGQQLGAGDLVGLSGNTGRVRGASGGYHLHFGAKDAKGRRIDPNGILKDPSILGTGAPSAGLPPPPKLENLAAQYEPTMVKGMEMFTKYMPQRSTEGLDMMAEEARKGLSKEEREKARKQDMWATLSQIGFNMAASNSPYFLQAVGAAAAAALPGAKEDKKAREAAKRENIRTLAEVEGIKYNQAAEKVKFGQDYLRDVLGLKKEDQAAAVKIWETEAEQAGATQRTIISESGATTRANIAAADRIGAEDKSDIILRRQATLQASIRAEESLKDNKEYAAARKAGNTARMDVLRQQQINKFLGEVLGDPGADNQARLADAWYADIKGMIARGEKIYTPQGKEIVVYRGGKPQPLNTLSDAGIRRLAEQYAGVAPSASSGGSSVMAEADRILAGQ